MNHTVSVFAAGFGHYHAACSCDWVGQHRWIAVTAKQDAWDHAVKTSHMPGSPLVVTL